MTAASSPALIRTALGDIQGQSANGVQVFKGIRFAKAPVGSLRFLPPVPVDAWDEPLQALDFGAVAIQPYNPTVDHSRAQMDEDCLFLNVWAPSAPGPHPVMVWIHGGGQTFGSTRRPEYDGQAFARSGVVCVTVAYRLGAFGFLELGPWLGQTYAGSGNNALRDIQAALQWVQSHIAHFGGDPDQVTLGGESAGAKNAAALLAAPACAGLFHRLVVLSGGADTWLPTSAAHDVAERFMAQVGVTPADPQRLLDLPADVLLQAQEVVAAAGPVRFPFRPVVDGDWLPQAPLDLVSVDPSAAVPLLIATCRDECVALVDPQGLDARVPGQGLAHQSAEQFAAFEARYDEAFGSLSAFDRRLMALTAEEYLLPSWRMAEAFVSAGAPVWKARFDHGTPWQGALRAAHVADLPYWWNNLPVDGAAPSAVQAHLASAMHQALVRFVNGNSPEGDGLTWPRYEPASSLTLSWAAQATVVKSPSPQELQAWAEPAAVACETAADFPDFTASDSELTGSTFQIPHHQ